MPSIEQQLDHFLVSISSLESTSTCPVSSKSSTTVSCPFPAAQDSGVLPSMSFESISTSSVSSNKLTTASCPFSAARESGVRPPVFSLESASACPPISAAHDNGVEPVQSFESTCTLPVSRRSSTTISKSITTRSYPFSAAQANGVRPMSNSCDSISTRPVSSNSWTTSSCPSLAAQDSAVEPVSSIVSTRAPS
ncbi:hypothetical protein BDV23DRAFT_171992 [Aspergillus alliaceus]|uniref:Uncharacterized protein n=1 Tax=Petromyces alliaceus TaxID=209559 RepID=A0A5N7C9R1_PETAA|nr:hypothetical protein BDV23DRAFT_171992 [Aspergillus alliaceus]